MASIPSMWHHSRRKSCKSKFKFIIPIKFKNWIAISLTELCIVFRRSSRNTRQSSMSMWTNWKTITFLVRKNPLWISFWANLWKKPTKLMITWPTIEANCMECENVFRTSKYSIQRWTRFDTVFLSTGYARVGHWSSEICSPLIPVWAKCWNYGKVSIPSSTLSA